MRRKILLTSLLVLAIALAACTKTSTSTTDASSTTPEMNTETTLLIGTLKLDGTDNEVDAEQSATLLPLWQMYQSLLMSDTAAQEEVDAVINQIQDSMTSEQLDAIDAMDLQPDDVMTVMQDMGLAMIPGRDGTSATPDLSTMPQLPEGDAPSFTYSGGGEAPGGGVLPSGGGVPPMGGRPGGDEGGMIIVQGEDGSGMVPEDGTSATPQAWQSGLRGGGSGFTLQLLPALIEYLQSQAGY